MDGIRSASIKCMADKTWNATLSDCEGTLNYLHYTTELFMHVTNDQDVRIPSSITRFMVLVKLFTL